jgi:ribose-phosphate pyrophosphokinase
MHERLVLIRGRAHRDLAAEIAQYLGLELGAVNLADFPDGEISCQLHENIRGRDVFLIQPTGPSVDKNLMELLIMIDACARASAERITPIIPYFGYARQDRKDQGRVPITAKLVANLISTAGADRVVTMDLHAAQIQGFFDVPVDHLYAAPVLDDYFKSLNIPPEELVVISPDEGSIKRSLQHLNNLGGQFAIVDKRRSSATETRQANLIGGPIEGKVALLFDDMISTGGSIVGAAQVAADHGAREIYLSASHAVFCGPAVERLSNAPVKQVVVTNSLSIPPEKRFDKLKTVTVAPLLGEAIRRIHRNESVSGLFG